MKANYKPIGDYIKKVERRNRDLKVTRLLGLSMTKEFRETTSNIIGTDMSVYRVMSKYQFACDFMSPIRVNKLPVVLKLDDEPNLVSPAYPVFEIKDRNELDPEYLMMWFRRTEFDRYATFKCDAAIRGGYEWAELCETLIPIPSISKQKEIVKEYNVIQNRITLNQQLIKKLEETAQAIYKQWFVDFEFPDENGKPYKSSGGEMVESELGEIPVGWEVKIVGDVVKCNSSTLTDRDKFETIEYLDTSSITNNEIEGIQSLNLNEDEIPSRAKRKVSHNDIIFSTVRPNLRHFGILRNPKPNMIVSTGFAVLKPDYPNICGELVYLLITNEENLQSLQARAEMSVSTYPSINPEDLLNINFVLPIEKILLTATEIFKSQFELSDNLKKEFKVLSELKNLLLSKLATIEN